MVDMKNINKKWRVVMPFDDKGKPLKTDLVGGKNTFDLDSAFIYCGDGSVHIDRFNEDVMRLTSFSISKLKTIRTKMNKAEIELLGYYELDSEGHLDFNDSDLDKVCKIAKAKKQRKSPVGITNIKDNYAYFLRTYKNVNVEYAEKLESWDKKRRK